MLNEWNIYLPKKGFEEIDCKDATIVDDYGFCAFRKYIYNRSEIVAVFCNGKPKIHMNLILSPF